MRKVVINGVEYAYTWGLGAQFIFETLTGKTVTDASWEALEASRTAVTHYSCLRNGGEEFSYSFAEFTRMVNDPKIAKTLNEALTAELARWNQDSAIVDDEDEKKGDKKKEK